MGVPYNILPTLCLKIFAIKLWGEVAQVGKWKADQLEHILFWFNDIESICVIVVELTHF